MLEYLTNWVIENVGRIFPYILSRFYTADKFNNKIKVKVRGEGDGITYEGGDIPKIRVWLVITNLSPVEIEIDRIIGKVSYGHTFCEIMHFTKHTLAAASEKDIFMECWLNESQINHLRANKNNNYVTRLYLNLQINSNIHNIALTRDVGTNNVNFMNIFPPTQTRGT